MPWEETQDAPSIISLLSLLDPMLLMASAGGPMNVRSACATRCANTVDSERKPYPGWIAEAPLRFATSSILSMTSWCAHVSFPKGAMGHM